jgi:Protein of unknown function (DUF2934)
MKTQGRDTHTEPESSQAGDEATGLVIEPAFDQETIAVLAYFYWEARGCPHDSPHEDWFRAEAELRSRLAAPQPPEEASMRTEPR